MLVRGISSTADFIHAAVLNALKRAPLSFFTDASVGELATVFSECIGLFDTGTLSGAEYMQGGLSWVLVVTVVISFYTSGVFLLLVACIGVTVCCVVRELSTAYFELPWIVSAAQASALEDLAELVHGAVVLRAFDQVPGAIQKHEALCDKAAQRAFQQLMCECWLELRASLIGSIGYTCVAMMVVILIENLKAGDAGILLVNAAFFSFLFVMVLENTLKMQEITFHRSLCSSQIEVMDSYRTNDIDAVKASDLPTLDWPAEGKVEVLNLRLRYSNVGEEVLKGVSFTVAPGEHCGVVGRTGAGKSSLVVAMSRLVEPCGGTVRIDGFDVAEIADVEVSGTVLCFKSVHCRCR